MNHFIQINWEINLKVGTGYRTRDLLWFGGDPWPLSYSAHLYNKRYFLYNTLLDLIWDMSNLWQPPSLQVLYKVNPTTSVRTSSSSVSTGLMSNQWQPPPNDICDDFLVLCVDWVPRGYLPNLLVIKRNRFVNVNSGLTNLLVGYEPFHSNKLGNKS